MFSFQIFTPTMALRPYVQYYVVAEIGKPTSLSAIQEVFPMTLSGINFLNVPDLFVFSDNEGKFTPTPQISLIGQLTTTRTNKFLRSGHIISVIFSPFGLYKFWGLNMTQLSDNVNNALDVLDESQLKACHRQMFEAKSYVHAVDTLEKFLLTALSKKNFDSRGMDIVYNFIRANKGNIDIDCLANLCYMSTKTFERHFAEKIGLTPKVFTRIVRFCHAMKMLQSRTAISDIVESCGYFDQAHLIKEFKFFAGNSPRKFYCGLQEPSKVFMENTIKE